MVILRDMGEGVKFYLFNKIFGGHGEMGVLGYNFVGHGSPLCPCMMSLPVQVDSIVQGLLFCMYDQFLSQFWILSICNTYVGSFLIRHTFLWGKSLA